MSKVLSNLRIWFSQWLVNVHSILSFRWFNWLIKIVRDNILIRILVSRWCKVQCESKVRRKKLILWEVIFLRTSQFTKNLIEIMRVFFSSTKWKEREREKKFWWLSHFIESWNQVKNKRDKVEGKGEMSDWLRSKKKVVRNFFPQNNLIETLHVSKMNSEFCSHFLFFFLWLMMLIIMRMRWWWFQKSKW